MHSFHFTFFTTLSLLSSSLFATADPLLYSYSLVQKRSSVPPDWNDVGNHPPSALLPLRFGLAQSNIADIDDLLLDVSDPVSPNYGKHWTPSQVADKFKPSLESVKTVHNWLVDSGIDKTRIRLSSGRTWIELNATVKEAESLLKTEYHVYEHKSGMKHVACEAYYLPSHILPHVDLVTPTIDFTAILGKRGLRDAFRGHHSPFGSSHHKVGLPGWGLHPKTKGPKLASVNVQQSSSASTSCSSQITLSCLKSLYGINYTPASPSKNSFAIVEYTPQAYVAKDLDLFFKTYSSSLVGKRPVLKAVDGGVVGAASSFTYNGESNLDLEYAMGLVGSTQPVTLYQVGDTVEGASFNNLLDALDGSYCKYQGGDNPDYDGIYPDPYSGGYKKGPDCGTFQPAHVISTSYGFNEADVSPAYAVRQCNEYAKLGLMGVTVIYSSGDDGVAGNGGTCLNKDGSQTAKGTIFNPTFPSTCPYITSVGATQINPGAAVTAPESACNQVIYSGGGFSNQFAIPSYQKTAMTTWRKSKPSYSASIWNSTGVSRGYPDLSANGANYVVSVEGSFVLVYGTSASAPVVGAIISMINDARITKGKKPVGFINPSIYTSSFQSSFHDITSGKNPGCGTNGFSAIAGWDPVTGLGTPNFPKLLASFLALP